MGLTLIQIDTPRSWTISQIRSGSIPVIMESVEIAFNYEICVTSATWRSEEYEDNEDLIRSGLEASCDSDVVR